jgi:hypothetical protein
MPPQKQLKLRRRIVRARARMGFEDRNPATKLPQLDIVSVNQFLGALFCRLLVGTIKIGRAYKVATFIQKVNSIVQHPHGPQAWKAYFVTRRKTTAIKW